MRPVELELSGFAPYRTVAKIDFRNADLFALSGPTGSGKSSIVDAIVFALYGSVPRYASKNLVEPLITLGKNEAKIRFDFTVGGEPYTVARVVRRTKSGGATTAEARLERGGSPISSGAAEVSRAVEELLGLTYEHFIKAVVLPQGEFARFLHDKPRDRQELLRELLDLHVYRKIRDLANDRKARAETALTGHLKEVELLSAMAGRDQVAAEKHVEKLEALRDTIAETTSQAAAIDAEIDDLTKQIDQSRETLTLLDIHRPDGLDDLVRRVEDADRAVDEANRLAKNAFRSLDAQEQAVAVLPEVASIEELIAKSHRRNELADRLGVASKEKDDSAAAVRRLRDQMGEAEQALAAASNRLETLRRSHAAHELAAKLEVGHPCPVCGTPVATLPSLTPVADLESAEKEVALRVAAHETAQKALTDAEVTHGTAGAHVDALAGQLASIELELEGLPAVEELRERLTRIQAAREKLTELKRTLTAANAALGTAEQQQAALSGERKAARAAFHTARDRVAMLEPPPAELDDLASQWTTLAEWATTRKAEITVRIRDLETHSKETSKRAARLTDTLRTLRAELPQDASPDEAVFAARKDVEEILKAQRRTEELAGDISVERERSQVAAALARHLHSNQFESWILEEALVDLTAGANDRLGELSGRAYSMKVDSGEFQVIDHRNADQCRSVRTLSGGETFLVSLALALSLSEQLTTMSIHGTSKLESIFLDEGFGTLDQETLDVVASVVQELGASGLTVGLISHVPDLADQVPTRFIVTKDVAGAHVERVDA